jgi:hypothetical protein
MYDDQIKKVKLRIFGKEYIYVLDKYTKEKKINSYILLHAIKNNQEIKIASFNSRVTKNTLFLTELLFSNRGLFIVEPISVIIIKNNIEVELSLDEIEINLDFFRIDAFSENLYDKKYALKLKRFETSDNLINFFKQYSNSNIFYILNLDYEISIKNNIYNSFKNIKLIKIENKNEYEKIKDSISKDIFFSEDIYFLLRKKYKFLLNKEKSINKMIIKLERSKETNNESLNLSKLKNHINKHIFSLTKIETKNEKLNIISEVYEKGRIKEFDANQLELTIHESFNDALEANTYKINIILNQLKEERKEINNEIKKVKEKYDK